MVELSYRKLESNLLDLDTKGSNLIFLNSDKSRFFTAKTLSSMENTKNHYRWHDTVSKYHKLLNFEFVSERNSSIKSLMWDELIRFKRKFELFPVSDLVLNFAIETFGQIPKKNQILEFEKYESIYWRVHWVKMHPAGWCRADGFLAKNEPKLSLQKIITGFNKYHGSKEY